MSERDGGFLPPLNPSELDDALSTDNDDRHDYDWQLIEMAAEKWLSEKINNLRTNLCDCERSYNGFGISGRECDCPAGDAPEIRALRAENARLKEALNWFLNDDRFQVFVGGNPNVVTKMFAEARASLSGETSAEPQK